MTDDRVRYVVYARQSLSREGDDSLSIEMQVKACREYVAQRGGTVVGVFEDPDTRGWRTDRPAFTQMLDRFRTGSAEIAVVFKLSRFARNLIHQETVLNEIAGVGGELVSVTEPYLNTSPMVRQILGAVNEQLRRDQSDFLTAAFAARARRGLHHGYAPMGYMLDDAGKLRIDDATAGTVCQMFAWALEGYGSPDIIERLTAAGITTPQGRAWAPNGVFRVLRNPVYVGDVRHGGTVVASDAHDPIIDRETFSRVQAVLDGRSIVRRKRHTSWVEGFAYHVCGKRMYLMAWQRSQGHRPQPRFRCHGAFGPPSNRCTSGRQSMFADRVEALFIGLLVDALSNVATPEEAQRRIESTRDNSARERQRARARMERRLEDLTRQRDKLLDLALAGRVDDEMYVMRDAVLKADIANVRAEIEQVPKDVSLRTLEARHAMLVGVAGSLIHRAERSPERLPALLHALDVRLIVGPDDAYLVFGDTTAPFVGGG
jgi:site-specific DNA recombinase